MEILRDENYIWIEAEPADYFDNVLRHAFQMVRDDPNPAISLTIGYLTMCSAGKITVNKASNYEHLMAAFERAQRHEGEFKDCYNGGVHIGP